jgi:putative transposase
VWEVIHTALRALVREKSGRLVHASAAISDSQSVKSTAIGGLERGYDGAKNTKGRKRHILVDTQGLLMGVSVHSAALADRDGGILLLEKTAPLLPTVQKLWTDSAYNGRFRTWSKEHLPSWDIEMVKHCWSALKAVWLAPGQKPPTIPTGLSRLTKTLGCRVCSVTPSCRAVA